MKRRLLVLGTGFLVLGLVMAALVGFYIFVPIQPKTTEITITPGMTLKQIGGHLEKGGFVRNAWAFMTYTTLTGSAQKLQAGDYRFKKPVTVPQVLRKLVKGLVILNKIQIIEGWTVEQIADYLAQQTFIKDPSFVETFLLLAKDQEGYLFPETYNFSSSAAPQDYLKTFVTHFEKFYLTTVAHLTSLPTFSMHEIVTLASMIEKETGVGTERPWIASVFYNRLKKKMPLSSDPTVIYGLKNFDGNLRKEDLANPHPYNTYVHPGLPPGPICNPGRASILAALQPAQTDYLYFVSKNDGTHHFSKTAAEHANAVRTYQTK